MLERLVETVGSGLRTALSLATLVVLIGVTAHVLTWLVFRRRALTWVWGYWNVVGAALMVLGLGAIGYGWLAFGLATGAGSALVGLGLLLASAGLWMIVPV